MVVAINLEPVKLDLELARLDLELAMLDLAGARLVVVFDEPVDGILEAVLERRKLERFTVLARLAHEPHQLLVRRWLAVLPVRLAWVELYVTSQTREW